MKIRVGVLGKLFFASRYFMLTTAMGDLLALGPSRGWQADQDRNATSTR